MPSVHLTKMVENIEPTNFRLCQIASSVFNFSVIFHLLVSEPDSVGLPPLRPYVMQAQSCCCACERCARSS